MAITWGELKELLKDAPDDTVLVLAGDGAGNKFSPLVGIGAGVYVPDSTWSGEFSSDPDVEAAPEDRAEYDHLAADENAVNAYCFWPVN